MRKYRKLRDISSTITDVIKRDDPVFAFYTFQGHVLKTQITAKKIKKELNQIVFHAQGENLLYLQEMVSGSGKINLYLPSDSIMFSCEMKNLDEEGYMVTGLPEVIYSFDRRSDERFFLEEPILVTFKWKKRTFTKECYDLSAGGLSLVFSKSEAINFKDGDFVDEFKICYGKKHIPVKAMVVGKRKIDPYTNNNIMYSGLKFSMSFKDQEPALKKLINAILEGHTSLVSQSGNL
jgi:hypothetical protein